MLFYMIRFLKSMIFIDIIKVMMIKYLFYKNMKPLDEGIILNKEI